MKRWVGDCLAMQDEFGGGVAGFDVVELVADLGKGLGRGGAWWSGQRWQWGARSHACAGASAGGEVGRARTSQPLTGRLQIGPGQHYFCYHAQLASLAETWSAKVLRNAAGHGLIRGPLVTGVGRA
jgi:hypothetical protein